MPAHQTSTEALLEAVAWVHEAGGNVTQAAEAHGVPRPTLQKRYRLAIKRGLDDAIVHEAPSGHTVKGVSTYYTAEGKVLGQWVKTKVGEPSIEEMIESVQGAFDEYASRPILDTPPHYTNADFATVYPLPDWHVGLLSWGHETGFDWDLAIAKRTILQTMSTLISRSPPSHTAVVLGLGDLLHADGYDNRTEKSKHPLDVDGRWPKVLKAATEMIVEVVELALLQHENVHLRILPGNHDQRSAITVAYALSMYFRSHPRVLVDDSPSYFWWWRWGATLLGATHGDQARMADLPLLMAAQNPEAWGKTKYRAIFTGHIHTQTGVEKGGVTVESFRTPVAPDSWNAGMGHNAGRTVTSITYHKEDGEASRSRAPVKIMETVQ